LTHEVIIQEYTIITIKYQYYPPWIN
jgi:hypothetical protein